MKSMQLICLALFVLFFGGCDGGAGDGDTTDGSSSTRFNIRVVAETSEDLENFETIISALESKGLTATLLLAPDFVQTNCQRVQALQSAGFEIMAYAPVQEIDGQSVTLSMLTEEEQADYLQAVRDAFDECLAVPVEGFGSAGYDQDENTWRTLDEQGYVYNLGFLARTVQNLPGHEGAFLPYQSEDYAFWAVPVYTAYIDKQWTPLSDAYCINQMDATEWEALLKNQLAVADDAGRPFMVEVYAQYTGADADWLSALENLITEAQQKQVIFASIKELVVWAQSQAASLDCNCLQ